MHLKVMVEKRRAKSEKKRRKEKKSRTQSFKTGRKKRSYQKKKENRSAQREEGKRFEGVVVARGMKAASGKIQEGTQLDRHGLVRKKGGQGLPNLKLKPGSQGSWSRKGGGQEIGWGNEPVEEKPTGEDEISGTKKKKKRKVQKGERAEVGEEGEGRNYRVVLKGGGKSKKEAKHRG